MKSFTLTFLFLALFVNASAQEQRNFLPQWQEGCFDIHNIATGKGDATFIVMPDGTRMLIDAGDMTGSRFICPAYPSDSLTPARWIARYIEHFSKGTPGKPLDVDYFSLTHFHSDHMGNVKAMKPGPDYGLCGITELAEYVHFSKLVDRDFPDYDFPGPHAVREKGMDNYVRFMNCQKEKGVKTEKFTVGSHKQFALVHNARAYRNFDVYNIAGGGYVNTGKGRKPMFTTDPAELDENMFSTVLLFSYGKFKYYNGGDLGGGRHGDYVNWRDFESQVADLMGPVTVMKADHHAWKEVLNPYFIWKTRPQAIFVQCSHINHPWKDTVQRLLDPLLPVRPDIFVTTDSGRSQVGEELFSAIKPAGHIVCRVYEGGSSYEIFVLDASSLDYHIIWRSGVKQL